MRGGTTTLADQTGTGRMDAAGCNPANHDGIASQTASAITCETSRAPFGPASHGGTDGERDVRHGIQIIDRHGFTTPSGFAVNFTVGRTVSRKGKPGGESPLTGQHLPASVTSPDAGYCGGVGPHDCPAASFDPSFHEVTNA